MTSFWRGVEQRAGLWEPARAFKGTTSIRPRRAVAEQSLSQISVPLRDELRCRVPLAGVSVDVRTLGAYHYPQHHPQQPHESDHTHDGDHGNKKHASLEVDAGIGRAVTFALRLLMLPNRENAW